jgi:hypothetical protein
MRVEISKNLYIKITEHQEIILVQNGSCLEKELKKGRKNTKIKNVDS